jgi:hypothetical protein
MSCHLLDGAQSHIHMLESIEDMEPSYKCNMCGDPIYKGVIVADSEKFCDKHSHWTEYCRYYATMYPQITIGELFDLEHSEVRFTDNGLTISKGK